MSAFEDLIERYSRPHPLGNVWVSSNRIEGARWDGRFDGAMNLLVKAQRALASGDEGRADALLRRAIAIPFDRFEERLPGVTAAEMMLFDVVVDEIEADEDDPTWLEAALVVLDQTGTTGRADLQDCLAVIGHDYHLKPTELAIVEQAVADRDRSIAPLQDLVEGECDLVQRVRNVLYVCMAYEAALADLG